MPCWYYEKPQLKLTPSYKDGIQQDKETRYRREGSSFIMDLGQQMGLRRDTMATGVVFYHRFYMIHSFNEFPRYVMATCCLFLAGKVEETPKKCKDLVRAAKQLLETKKLDKYWPNVEDPIKEVMTFERILLQTIKFDLQVDHPYSYLLKYAKTLKGDQESIRKMVQMAWTFINDSYCTTLCLQWEPEIIAIALMYLTSKLSKFEINDWIGKKENNNKQKWWEQFVEGLNVEIMEDICHQVLDLYAQQQQQQQLQSPGQINTNNNNTGEKAANIKRKSPSREQTPQEPAKYFKPNEPQQYRHPLQQPVNSNNIMIVNEQPLPPPPLIPQPQHYIQQQHYGMMPPTTCTPPVPPFISPMSTYNATYHQYQQQQMSNKMYPTGGGQMHLQQLQPHKPIMSAYDNFFMNNSGLLQQQQADHQLKLAASQPPPPPPPPPPSTQPPQSSASQQQQTRGSTLRMVDISGRKP